MDKGWLRDFGVLGIMPDVQTAESIENVLLSLEEVMHYWMRKKKNRLQAAAVLMLNGQKRGRGQIFKRSH